MTFRKRLLEKLLEFRNAHILTMKTARGCYRQNVFVLWRIFTM